MSNNGCTLVCELISKCPTLEEIMLQNNNIDNEGAQVLVQVIKGRKITRLDIDGNPISGSVLAALLQVVPVSKLNIVRKQLSDAQVEPIKNNMLDTRNLKVLYMSHNNMSDRAFGLLAEGI